MGNRKSTFGQYMWFVEMIEKEKKDLWSLDIFYTTYKLDAYFNYLYAIGKAPNTIEHSVNYIAEVIYLLFD